MRVRALLHRAGHVDEQENRTRPAPAPQPLQGHDLAVVADRGLQAAREVDARPAAGPPAAVAATPGQRLGKVAAEAAERLRVVRLTKAAYGQRLGFRGGAPALVRLLADQHLAGAAILLHGHVLVRQPFLVAAESGNAEKMHVEQPVEALALFRMRGEGRDRRLAEMLDASGSEELGRLQKVVVCSGATANPFWRRRVGKATSGRTEAGRGFIARPRLRYAPRSSC
jgi:hypothetical protein